MDIITLKSPPAVLSSAAVVGKKEFDGPLGKYFHAHSDDDMFSQDTFEKAEAEMIRASLTLSLKRGEVKPNELDAVFAGDLTNQCTSSSYGLLDFNVPFFGIYGACSTMAEGLILASLCMQSGELKKTAVCAASHFCTAERQFRSPLEYGGQRSPTSQWTATAAGSVILGEGNGKAYITELLPGRSVDSGITDLSNMGAAMAPAAFDTLKRYFTQSGLHKEDFDLIVTGDLGNEGFNIVSDFLSADGIDLHGTYNDCGLMLYDREKQDVHAGGSGCGCSAAVLCGYIMNGFESGIIKNALLVCTGALMSPLTLYQGERIASIAHLVRISSQKSEGK